MLPLRWEELGLMYALIPLICGAGNACLRAHPQIAPPRCPIRRSTVRRSNSSPSFRPTRRCRQRTVPAPDWLNSASTGRTLNSRGRSPLKGLMSPPTAIYIHGPERPGGKAPMVRIDLASHGIKSPLGGAASSWTSRESITIFYHRSRLREYSPHRQIPRRRDLRSDRTRGPAIERGRRR